VVGLRICSGYVCEVIRWRSFIEPGMRESSTNSEHGIVKKEPFQREKCENRRKDCCFHLCDAI
jgi:hypothetical protein